MLNPGIKGSASVAVTAANTAAAMGSGELPVLATPAVAALIERACWQSVAAELELDQGTVGTALTLASSIAIIFFIPYPPFLSHPVSGSPGWEPQPAPSE